MTKVLKSLLLALVTLVATTTTFADNLSFDPTIKFRFESVYVTNANVALGSKNGVNSPLCVTTNFNEENGCYWYLQEYKVGCFALCNSQTGEYVVFDNVRSDNPYRRYVHMESTVRNDSALWRIVTRANGAYAIQSVANENYFFNVRSNNHAVGGYSGSGGTSNNELFYIYKEDAYPYDPQKDINYICGKDKEGFYWTKAKLDMPVACTTDDNDPIYYYITNVRTNCYVYADVYLQQSNTLPKNRFYFKQAKDGVQIMVEGGGYVSGLLPNSKETSPKDVTIGKGSPNTNDQTWSIGYYQDWIYPGYYVGVATSSSNNANNYNIYNKYIYWNDYQATGLCFYAVDGGSTFQFHSKDIRHRDYLASKGLVIPTDSITPTDPVDPPVGPTDPVDPEDPTADNLENITSPILFVHRADGKVDAIPEQYIQTKTDDASGLNITTLNDGPTFSYMRYEVDSVTHNAPANLPTFNSFKFNNKFNHHLVEDANGVFMNDTLINVDAICIGKRLRPSFKVDDDVQVFIGHTEQHSKQTRTRYAKDVKYTIARHGQTILRRTTEGEYLTYPYGRQCTVHVNFATDNSRGEYKVPTVYITTEKNSPITSKTYYLNATISIDGAGVFADMPETAMQIKGRGNTSWTTTGKAPYHMKFEETVKPFGLTKGKHWNLIANAQRNSMTSNAVAMKVAQLVETAGFNHEIPVDLYLNGEYRGSYNFTEKVGFANNSIDLVDESYAVMLELDSYYDEAYKFRTSYLNYYLPVNVKEPDLSLGTSALTLTEISRDFDNVMTALSNKEDMKYYFDLDYLARFLLVNDLVMNTELSHPKSTFLYKEDLHNSDGRYIFGPVWDFDWSYGYQFYSDYFVCSPSIDFWSSTSFEAINWLEDMRYCGESFNKKYYQLWYEFMNNGSLDELVEFCQDYYDFASASFTHDHSRWYHGDAKTYSTITSNAKSWLRNRAKYIYEYMSSKLGYADKGYIDETAGKPLRGDVNGDGSITTADVVCVLNHMLNLPNEDFEYEQADLDNNDMITINDAINVRNLIGTQSTKSGRFYSLPEAEAAIYTDIASHTATGVEVPMVVNVADGQYSGLQFDLRIPAGMVIEDLDLTQSIPNFDFSIAELDNSEYADANYERYRVSIYSSALNTIPQGKSQIKLLLGWGCGDKSKGLMSTTLSEVMFVNSRGEDERSGSYTAQFVADDLTGLDGTASLLDQNGNQLTFSAGSDTVLAVYGVDGRVFRYYDLKAGATTISLPVGIYIIGKQKFTIK